MKNVILLYLIPEVYAVLAFPVCEFALSRKTEQIMTWLYNFSDYIAIGHLCVYILLMPIYLAVIHCYYAKRKKKNWLNGIMGTLIIWIISSIIYFFAFMRLDFSDAWGNKIFSQLYFIIILFGIIEFFVVRCIYMTIYWRKKDKNREKI